jgi:hypothetical protein
MIAVLYTIAVILLIAWIIGLVVHVTFWAIHLLIVAAVIIVLWHLLVHRRGAV